MDTKKIDLYATVGGVADKCIAGAPDNSFKEEPIQLAVTAGIGITSVSYTHLDVYKRQDAENSDISYVINENHNRENNWFVAITAPWQPLNWLNLNASFIGVRQDIRMYREDDYFGHFLYFANANATVLLPSDYSLEAQYNGVSRLYSGNSGIDPRHTFNLHLRKKWKDGRCVATLGVDNISVSYTHLASIFIPNPFKI